ncbi:TPA: integrase core domain-containing protein, partial [Pseudomonas aeruginosa]
AWRRDYNEHRPHSAIGNLAPAEFAASWPAIFKVVVCRIWLIATEIAEEKPNWERRCQWPSYV